MHLGHGTYFVDGNRVEWSVLDGGGIAPNNAANKPGEFFVFGWSRYRDTLTLTAVPGEISPTNFMVKPWRLTDEQPSAAVFGARCPPPAEAIENFIGDADPLLADPRRAAAAGASDDKTDPISAQRRPGRRPVPGSVLYRDTSTFERIRGVPLAWTRPGPGSPSSRCTHQISRLDGGARTESAFRDSGIGPDVRTSTLGAALRAPSKGRCAHAQREETCDFGGGRGSRRFGGGRLWRRGIRGHRDDGA